jgi:hypothetical protein
MMSDEVRESGGLAAVFLMRDEATGEIYWKGVIVLYLIPLITLLSIFYLKCIRKQQP